MLTCGSCTDKDCPDTGTSHTACDVFTQDDIEEALPDWQPTLADFEKLEKLYIESLDEVTRLEARIAGFEKAIAELVRWAQDETP